MERFMQRHDLEYVSVGERLEIQEKWMCEESYFSDWVVTFDREELTDKEKELVVRINKVEIGDDLSADARQEIRRILMYLTFQRADTFIKVTHFDQETRSRIFYFFIVESNKIFENRFMHPSMVEKVILSIFYNIDE